MNSKLFRLAFKDYFPELLGDTRELSKVFFENITIKEPSIKTEKELDHLITKVINLKKEGKDYRSTECEIEKIIYQVYEITSKEERVLEAVEGVFETDKLIKSRSLTVSS